MRDCSDSGPAWGADNTTGGARRPCASCWGRAWDSDAELAGGEGTATKEKAEVTAKPSCCFAAAGGDGGACATSAPGGGFLATGASESVTGGSGELVIGGGLVVLRRFGGLKFFS